jgi:hypothetical protein
MLLAEALRVAVSPPWAFSSRSFAVILSVVHF